MVDNSPIVQSDAIGCHAVQCVDLTWGATLVQPDGKRAAQHMAASDRFTLGVLSFLSLGTFAAIFAATQERKVERYRRQGRPLPPGFE